MRGANSCFIGIGGVCAVSGRTRGCGPGFGGAPVGRPDRIEAHAAPNATRSGAFTAPRTVYRPVQTALEGVDRLAERTAVAFHAGAGIRSCKFCTCCGGSGRNSAGFRERLPKKPPKKLPKNGSSRPRSEGTSLAPPIPVSRPRTACRGRDRARPATRGFRRPPGQRRKTTGP